MEENKPHVFKLMLRILLFLVLIIGSVRPVVNHSAEQMDSQIRNTVYSVNGIEDLVHYALSDVKNLMLIGTRNGVDTAPLENLHKTILNTTSIYERANLLCRFSKEKPKYLSSFAASSTLSQNAKDTYLYQGLVKRLDGFANQPAILHYQSLCRAYYDKMQQYLYRMLADNDLRNRVYPEVGVE